MSIAAQPSGIGVDSDESLDTEQLLTEIAYMGALYGLNKQSRAVLKHLASIKRTRKAANIGEALNLIITRKYTEAAQTLERQIDEETVPIDIAQVLLALACRLGSFSQTHADDILQRIDENAPDEVKDFAYELRKPKP